MALRIRRILVAIADASAKKVLGRVCELARESGAQIELFSVVRPGPGVASIVQNQQRLINRAVIEAKRNELEAAAIWLSRRGVDAPCSVAMDYSVTDAIVRRARQTGADLVAIEAHKHNLLSRMLLSQSDYDLIRHCPVPLLIVKLSSAASSRPVLAALDPWHMSGKPHALDARIIEAGRAVSKILGAALHGVHVYPPNVGFVADAAFSPVAMPVSLPGERKYSAMVRRRFNALNVKYKIAARNTHLQMGDPAFVLPEIARSLKAQMLVMGAISRSVIKRILIGNTAEKVLDAVPCDLLIVKSKSFRDHRPTLRYSSATGEVRRYGSHG